MDPSPHNQKEEPGKDNPALSKVIERNIRTIIVYAQRQQE